MTTGHRGPAPSAPLDGEQLPRLPPDPVQDEGGTGAHQRRASSQRRSGALDAGVAALAARRGALADVWMALWTSRLLVWLTAIYAMLTVGFRPTGGPTVTGAPFGNLGELVFGPAERWDGAFYVSVAEHGYHAVPLSAFFPFYPISIRAVSEVIGSPLVAGIAVSVGSFAVALYLLHRLVAIELGSAHARTAVLVFAFLPTSFFFSVVYPEALLLALTVGAVYAARTGHWAWAALLGALASATHNSGALVAIPIALLYLYGPRADREPSPARSHARWMPRYPLRLDFLWLAIVPLGLLAFFAYMGIAHGDALRPLHVNETYWHRHFELLGGVTRIPSVLWHGLHTAANAPPALLFPTTNGPYRGAAINVVDAGALVFALVGTIGVARRLPVAYSVYTVVSMVILTSAPKAVEPLASLPRYLLVLFPIPIWLSLWLDERKRLPVWLACSGLILGAFTMQFATGRWVA